MWLLGVLSSLLISSFLHSQKKKNVIVSCTWPLVIWQGILIFDQGAQALINKDSKWKWRIFFLDFLGYLDFFVILWEITQFFWIFVENIWIFLDFWKYFNFFGFLWTNRTYRTQQRTDTAISVPFEGLINSLSFILPNWRWKYLKLNLSEKMTKNKIISNFKRNSR